MMVQVSPITRLAVKFTVIDPRIPMRIGIPKEIKTQEFRVGMVPHGVHELVIAGHEVLVQSQAGTGMGCDDQQFIAAGARIVLTAADVFAADLIVKVKEPQPSECQMLRADQVLFTYLHLAADLEQAKGLMASGATAIAYETVTAADGSLPLLTPMSEVAGRMAVQVGAACLEKERGGSGVLLGGVTGVAPGNVVIIGGGVAGTNAAQMAVGMHANVTVVDRSLLRLRQLDALFAGRIRTAYSTAATIETLVRDADLVIGTVLIPGAAAPKVVTHAMIKKMKPGSALVDVAIDQGGCFETSRPTTHSNPTFIVDGIVHYCVANIPGAVARTSTFALTNATLPFVKALAVRGLSAALSADPHLRNGVNVHSGAITHKAVAEALGLPYRAA
jgi:alanine dehydrogenase